MGGGGGGGGKAITGGGGGGTRIGGSGGGGGNKAISGSRPSGRDITRAPRNSGNVITKSRPVVRDRNVGADRRVDGPRGDRRSGHRGAHRGTRHVWGGLSFYFYDGYYHGDCGWLRRRAQATGSRYWWIRYRQCRELD